MAERLAVNQEVGGSSPPAPAIYNKFSIQRSVKELSSYMRNRIGVKKAITLLKEVIEKLELKCTVKESFSAGGPVIEVRTVSSQSRVVRKSLPLIFEGYQLIVIKNDEK